MADWNPQNRRSASGAASGCRCRFCGCMAGWMDQCRKIVPLLDDLWPESESILFDKAAHASFVSPSATFCEPLLAESAKELG